MQSEKEKYIDWKIILFVCSIIVATLMGIRNCFGLFLEPVSLFINSGKEIFSLGMAIQALTWGLGSFIVGMIIDKFGSQKALIFGVLSYAIGIYILSEPNPLIIYSSGTLTGFGLGAGGMATIVAIIGKTAPPEKKSMAMGLVTAAASFGQFIFISPTLFSIKTFGWQNTMVFLSVITFSLLFLIPLLNQKKEKKLSHHKERDDFYFKEVIFLSIKNKNYILLNLGYFTCGFHVTFISLHLPSDLMSKGLSFEIAGWSLALIGLFNIIGALIAGWLGDKVIKKNSLAFIYLARSIIITFFILIPTSPFIALLFGSLMGLLWLATVPLTNGIILTFLGPKYLGTLAGIAFLSHQAGAVIGAWAGGKIYDTYGSYDNAWWISVLLGVTAFLFHIVIQEKPFQNKLLTDPQ